MSRRALRPRVAAVLAAVLAGALLAGCGGAPPAPAPRPDAVVVASFDFDESRLVAELYAQSLEQAGVPVQRELGLGPRELVLPALRQGFVDVVPEYLGTALAAATAGSGRPDDATADPAPAVVRLDRALRPDGLRALRPAAAQDQNALAVRRETAEALGLATTSDLVPHAPGLVLAGPLECPSRPYCLLGLQEVYGLQFRRFLGYETERQRLTALTDGVVDVAVVFSTDGLVAASDAVLLADDRRLQPAENLVPVVSERAVDRYGQPVVEALDAVSARLDSAALVHLSWRLAVAGSSVEHEARGWLLRRGLVPR